MAKTATRLGRGLSALITPRDVSSTRPAAELRLPTEAPGGIRQVPIDRVRPNPRQPRNDFDDGSLAELAESIRAKGLLQPIIVRPTADEAYELVAGERRWRAAKLAGLETVPAVVRAVSDAESLELALIENIQREDLAPLERAKAYQQYLDAFGGSIEELAQRISESRGNVSNYIRLLKLHNDIRALLASGRLAMGQARAIAGLADSHRQLALARLAVRRNLSVRQVEELVRRAEGESPAPEPDGSAIAAASEQRHLSDVEDALSKAIGLCVRLFPGKKKNSGRVVITYTGLEEFDRIAERIGGGVRLE